MGIKEFQNLLEELDVQAIPEQWQDQCGNQPRLYRFDSQNQGYEKVKDFGTISLTSSFKIIAEVSMKEIIPSIIQGKQCASVKIRTTYKGLTANECVGDYRTKKKKGLVVKLYRGNTYNRVIYGVCFG